MNDKSTSVPKKNSKQDTDLSPLALDKVSQLVYQSMPSVALGRFGLKNADDVKKMLLSPAGKSIKAEIIKKLIRLEAQEHMRQESLEFKLLMFLLRILFHHAALMKKWANMERVQEIIRQQQEQVSKFLKQTPAPSAAARTRAAQELLNLLLSKLELEYVHQGKQLETERLELIAEGQEIEELYAALQHSINDFESLNDLTPETISQHIDLINDQIAQEAAAIEAELDKGADVKELLKQHDGTYLKLAHLQDLQSMHAQNKYCYNALGKRCHAHEADFILPKEKIVVEHEGVYYLLNSDEDVNTIKENPTRKHEAQHAFEQEKHELMTVKKLVQHNRQTSIYLHQCRVKTNQDQIEENNGLQLLINNEKNIAKAAMSQALTEDHTPVKEPIPDDPIPQDPRAVNAFEFAPEKPRPMLNEAKATPVALEPPRPSPKNLHTKEGAPVPAAPKMTADNTPKPSAHYAAMTLNFKQRLAVLRERHELGRTHVSFLELNELVKQLPEGFLQQHASSILLRQIPGKIIPQVKLPMLLRQLNQIGIDPKNYKTAQPEYRATAPTPFKTSPY